MISRVLVEKIGRQKIPEQLIADVHFGPMRCSNLRHAGIEEFCSMIRPRVGTATLTLKVIRALVEDGGKGIVPKDRVEIGIVGRDECRRHVGHVGEVITETCVGCQG